MLIRRKELLWDRQHSTLQAGKPLSIEIERVGRVFTVRLDGKVLVSLTDDNPPYGDHIALIGWDQPTDVETLTIERLTPPPRVDPLILAERHLGNRRSETAQDLLDDLDPALLDGDRLSHYRLVEAALAEEQRRRVALPSAQRRILERWPRAIILESDEGLRVDLIRHGDEVDDLSVFRGDEVVALEFNSRRLNDIRPLSDCRRLRELGLLTPSVTDIEALRGLPLFALFMPDVAVSDLSPLADCALKHLWMDGSAVSDPVPLGQQAPVWLRVDGAPWDLPPMDGSNLFTLFLAGCNRVNLDAIRNPRLSQLTVAHTQPFDLAPVAAGLSLCQLTDVSGINLEPLRGLPLEQVSLQQLDAPDLSAIANPKLRRLVLNASTDLDFSPISLAEIDRLETHAVTLRGMAGLDQAPPALWLPGEKELLPEWFRQHLPVWAKRARPGGPAQRWRALDAWVAGERSGLQAMAEAVPAGGKLLPLTLSCSRSEAVAVAESCGAGLFASSDRAVRLAAANLADSAFWTTANRVDDGSVVWADGTVEIASFNHNEQPSGPVLIDHDGDIACELTPTVSHPRPMPMLQWPV
jgi:hypothetical protein